MRFADFDTRGYRTVDARTGYGEWVRTYEHTVQDAMDVALLEALEEVPWVAAERAADLGCGTGRTGVWLRSHGVRSIDGVDLTPGMLALARSKKVYDRLIEADVSETGLASNAYDLVTVCLVDEHLRDLASLYTEAARVARAGAHLVLVAYHPHFIMAAGVPTHYDVETGESVAIETHVHLISEHVAAGLQAGWTLVEMKERIIDDAWLALKPKWEPFRHHPISMALAWRRSPTAPAS